MKKLLPFFLLLTLAQTVWAQLPTLTTTQVSGLKTSYSSFTLSCSGLVKPEYQYIFDFVKKKPDGTCDLYTELVTLTMQLNNTQTGTVSTYLATPEIPGSFACSKIDLNNLKMRSNTGLDVMFAGFLNPSTGMLSSSLYLKTLQLNTNIPMREISNSIPNGGKVFSGSIQSGIYQVSAVLTIRNFCVNISG